MAMEIILKQSSFVASINTMSIYHSIKVCMKARMVLASQTHVSSVTIHSYSLEEIDTNDKRKRYANIHITIKMADSTVIEIKYSGIVSSDQMYG